MMNHILWQIRAKKPTLGVFPLIAAILIAIACAGCAVTTGDGTTVSGDDTLDGEPWQDTDVDRWASQVSREGFSCSMDSNASFEEIGHGWAEAFVTQYTDSTSQDSPLHSTNAAVLSAELYAESLMGKPKTLVYNMRFVCEASDAYSFERWYTGWAGPLRDAKYPQYEGWMEFGWFIDLEEDQAGGNWRCTGAGTGGFGGWGYLNYDDTDGFNLYMTELMASQAGTNLSEKSSIFAEGMIRNLPLVDWRTFDVQWGAEGWDALWQLILDHCVTEGQVYGPEETRMWSDVYPDDQIYRNLYVMLAALNVDSAYAENMAVILWKQQTYDPEQFELSLGQLTQEQQGIITALMAPS